MDGTSATPLPITVQVRGRHFIWTEEGGLDPEVVHAVEAWIQRQALRLEAVGLRAGVTREDLVQEGRLGALVAARRFDPSRRTTFLTFAAWWVWNRQALAISGTGVVIPKAVRLQLRRDGQLPSITSLDLPVGAELNSRLGDLIPDSGPDVHQESLPALLRPKIDKALRRLSERDDHVITRHYGLDGEPPECLAAIGARLGLTRERVRQIEAKGLVALRRAILRTLPSFPIPPKAAPMPTLKRPPVAYQLTIDDVLRAKAAEERREAAKAREAEKARKAAAKGQPLPLEGL